MRRYLKLSRLMVVLAVLAMGIFVASVSADTTSTGVNIPTIDDGRVNKFDISAPVAIYDDYVYPYADNVNEGVLDHIEFWGLVGTDTNIEKVMNVTEAQLAAVKPSATNHVLVASNDGYSLYMESNGSLTLVGPFNYVFNWTPGA